MALLTLPEYRTLTNVTAAQLGDDQAQALITSAIAVVENYVGYPLESASRVEYYSSNGRKEVPLRCRPVSSITSVYYDPYGIFGYPVGSFDATDFLVLGSEYALHRTSSTSKQGLLVRVGGTWHERSAYKYPYALSRDLTPSLGDIKVTYVAGYVTTPAAGFDTLPGDIKLAICQIIIMGLQFATRGGPIWSERLGDYNYELARSYLDLKTPILGTTRQILSKYKDLPW